MLDIQTPFRQILRKSVITVAFANARMDEILIGVVLQGQLSGSQSFVTRD